MVSDTYKSALFGALAVQSRPAAANFITRQSFCLTFIEADTVIAFFFFTIKLHFGHEIFYHFSMCMREQPVKNRLVDVLTVIHFEKAVCVTV